MALQSGAFQWREGRPVAAVDPPTAVKVRWSRVALPLPPSSLVRALGGGIWTAVLGDWDRSREGGEQAMLVHRIVVHPNFTDYQDDIGEESHASSPGLSCTTRKKPTPWALSRQT